MRRGTGTYPPGWKEFATQLKVDAGWACVRCHHPHDPSSGHCLTVHHVTMEKDLPFYRWWGFLVLCQRCHLTIQAKVDLSRPWIFEHSPWFFPFVAGFYAWKYLGLELTRPQVEARLDELLALEAMTIIGRKPLPLRAAP